MRRGCVMATVGSAVLLVVACGQATRSATPTATPTQTAAVTSSPATAAPVPTSIPVAPVTLPATDTSITGFGATLAVWNTHHVADNSPGLSPGCCYGNKVGGEDRWATVTVAGGHVTGYVLALNVESMRAATQEVRNELPPDAVVVHDSGVQATCQILYFRSASLGSALSAPAIGDPLGNVEVAFTSAAFAQQSASGVAFDPNRTDTASFVPLGPETGDAC
jgi:hypothetical protein